MKKIIALLTSLVMLSAVALPLSVAAAETQIASNVIISEDFAANAKAGINDFNKLEGTIGLKDKWQLSGTWGLGNTAEYYNAWASYQCTMTNTLTNSIDFSKKGEYEFNFATAKQRGWGTFVGVTLLDASGNQKLSLGIRGLDKSTYTDDNRPHVVTAWYNGVYHDSESFRTGGAGNVPYSTKAKIIINGGGNDIIKIKHWLRSSEEPTTWNLELTNQDLSSIVASKIRLEVRDVGCFTNVEVKSSELSAGKVIVEGTGTDFAKVNDEDTTTSWNASLDDYAVIDMGKPIKITSAEALVVSGSFELYVSENGRLADAQNICSLTEGINAVSTDKLARYVIVKGSGSLGEINLWGEEVKDSYLNVPTIWAGTQQILGNKNVLSSNEKIVVDFDENIDAPVSGGVTLTVAGKDVPVNYNVENDKITVVTTKALEGECVLTVSGAVKNSDGITMVDGNDFVAKFNGIKDIEVTADTIKNNTDSAVNLVPVTVNGNTITTGSPVTVGANSTENYSGNIVVNDFTTLSPASVKGATTNTVTIDNDITVNAENNTAVIKGLVSGVNMQRIGGRDVVVAVTSMNDSLEASKVIDMKSAKTDDNGEFSVTLTMDANKSGFFKPYVATNYSTAPATSKFYYISEQGENAVLNDFKGATTNTAMETAIKNNLASLGIDGTSYNTDIDTLVSAIAPEISATNNFTNVSDVAEVVRGALVKEEVKHTSSANDVKTILENKYEDFNANNTGWSKLDDTEKTAVATNVFESKADIEKAEDLKELYNAFVEEQLQNKSPIVVPTFTTQNIGANVGESIVLTVTTNDSKVNSLTATVKYDVTNLTYVKYTAENSSFVVTDDENGTITVTLPQISATENSYGLKNSQPVSIEFMPKSSNTFTTNATVETNVVVYDSNLAISRDYNFDNTVSVTVSKMEGESNPSGSIGGGSFGGGGSSGGSKGDYTGSYTPTGGATTAPKDDKKEELFTDIKDCEWAKEAIEYLAQNEIVNGTSEKIFAPNDNVKREEFAKMLVLAFDLYDADATCDFKDVNKSDWYYTYVASAVSNGIINGISEDMFGAGEYITREQMTAMLYRAIMNFAPYVTYEKEVEYADAGEISDWAVESVDAMSYFGAVNGVGENTFAPKGTATRAQSACIIYRVLKLFDETIGK